ncbi:hypothetical protein [Haloarcula brevis]|uniref:hypothetical protein n=1 Tax=Haloarcula brevis TaxID=3111453 RepID=UPI00300E6E16
MPSTSDIITGVKNPQLFGRYINRILGDLIPKWNNQHQGVDFMEEDWDNLVLLDACRFDAFADENNIPGELEYRHSKGCATPEFLETNFGSKELHDTVYITANGKIAALSDTITAEFHSVIPLFSEEWDDSMGVVPPERVTERALEEASKFPNKRVIVHYVQPHIPFIGADTQPDKQTILDDNIDQIFWMRVLTGEIDLSKDELWDAYIKTLRVTLPHVRELADGLEGKTVISADHGNAFGERARPIPVREWGHPAGVYMEELTKVPWLIQEGERKEITPEAPVNSELEFDEREVVDQLRHLGYR